MLEKAREIAFKAKMNPTQTMQQGIGYVAENPIAVTGHTLGTVKTLAAPAVGAVNPALGATMAAVPMGAPMQVGELALKKASPRYARVTKSLGDKARKSTFVRRVSSGAVGVGKGITNAMGV